MTVQLALLPDKRPILQVGTTSLYVDANEFWSDAHKVGNGCWRWLGHYNTNGYGKFYFWRSARVRTATSAHRVAYALWYGDPGKHVVDHLCNNRWCVNPQHLKATTNADNVGRAVRKEACPRGHAYEPNNLCKRKDGRRVCKICERHRALAYYYRVKEQHGTACTTAR